MIEQDTLGSEVDDTPIGKGESEDIKPLSVSHNVEEATQTIIEIPEGYYDGHFPGEPKVPAVDQMTAVFPALPPNTTITWKFKGDNNVKPGDSLIIRNEKVFLATPTADLKGIEPIGLVTQKNGILKDPAIDTKENDTTATAMPENIPQADDWNLVDSRTHIFTSGSVENRGDIITGYFNLDPQSPLFNERRDSANLLQPAYLVEGASQTVGTQGIKEDHVPLFTQLSLSTTETDIASIINEDRPIEVSFRVTNRRNNIYLMQFDFQRDDKSILRAQGNIALIPQ